MRYWSSVSGGNLYVLCLLCFVVALCVLCSFPFKDFLCLDYSIKLYKSLKKIYLLVILAFTNFKIQNRILHGYCIVVNKHTKFYFSYRNIPHWQSLIKVIIKEKNEARWEMQCNISKKKFFIFLRNSTTTCLFTKWIMNRIGIPKVLKSIIQFLFTFKKKKSVCKLLW